VQILSLSNRSGHASVVLRVVILAMLLQGTDFAQTPATATMCYLTNGLAEGFWGAVNISGWYTSGLQPQDISVISVIAPYPALMGFTGYTFGGPLNGPGYVETSQMIPPCLFGPPCTPPGFAGLHVAAQNPTLALLDFVDSGEDFIGTGNLACSTFTYTPPPPGTPTPGPIRVTNIMFNYAAPNPAGPQTNGLPFRQSAASKFVHVLNGGTDATGEWNTSTSLDEPALYVAGSTVSIKVRFQNTDNTVSSANMSALAIGKQIPNVMSTTVNFVNGISGNGGSETDPGSYVTMQLSRNTDSQLNRVVDSWLWMAANVNGNGAAPAPTDQSGPHLVYTILQYPGAPWYRQGEESMPWASALDFVMAINTDDATTIGQTTASGAATAITQYLFDDAGLQYDTINGVSRYGTTKGLLTFDLTGYMAKSKGPTINCEDQGLGVYTLSNLVGAYAYISFMQPFGYIKTTNLVGYAQTNSPFFNDSPMYAPPVTTIAPAESCNNLLVPPFTTFPEPRSYYTNHFFAILAAPGQPVFDATVGPATGSPFTAYITNSIDYSIIFNPVCSQPNRNGQVPAQKNALPTPMAPQKSALLLLP
jgi:hypothetical protein